MPFVHSPAPARNPPARPPQEPAARPRAEARAYLQTPSTPPAAGRSRARPDGRGRRPRHVENPLHDVQRPRRALR